METNSTNQKEQNLLRLFEEGKNFTEELMAENERLRMHLAGIRNEKRDLENKYVRVDVPRLQERVVILQEENQQLHGEVKELKDQYVSVEEENYEFAERYVEVERQNSNLINMYVASYRLHSTLDYQEVVRIVKEIVINMIGSEDFRVYLVDEQQQRLMLIAHEGDDPNSATIPIDNDIIGNCATGGDPFVAQTNAELTVSNGEPMACIPMKVGDKVMGVIVIDKLLIQKDGFEAVDHELFELLGGHAATAIYGSHLFSISERKRNTLAGFIELLKQDVSAPNEIASNVQ
jgi:GAF domain